MLHNPRTWAVCPPLHRHAWFYHCIRFCKPLMLLANRVWQRPALCVEKPDIVVLMHSQACWLLATDRAMAENCVICPSRCKEGNVTSALVAHKARACSYETRSTRILVDADGSPEHKSDDNGQPCRGPFVACPQQACYPRAGHCCILRSYMNTYLGTCCFAADATGTSNTKLCQLD